MGKFGCLKMQKGTIQDENFLVHLKKDNAQAEPGRGKEQGLSSISGYGRKPPAFCMDPAELSRGSMQPASHYY